MVDYATVIQDRFRTRASELAVQLGLRAPKVEFLRLPPKCWLPEGVLAYTVFLREVIVITPTFEEFSPAEQDAQLAHWTVRSHLIRTALFKYLGATVLFTLLTFVPLNVTGHFHGHPFAFTYTGFLVNLVMMPREMYWLAETLWLASLCVIGIAWKRRIIYRTDRRVAEMLGLSAMNDVLRVARRVRYQRRGIVGMYVNLGIPSEANRADAISCFPLTIAEAPARPGEEALSPAAVP
ncbi:hypothetical protein ACFVUS_07120 [Nocardia sp. NPDC058058]|uniref:hypothetical protein n=1 Tax=Nocardia sp. NPDC058058 TaxID=3346317 RepID=UPI0036DCB16D